MTKGTEQKATEALSRLLPRSPQQLPDPLGPCHLHPDQPTDPPSSSCSMAWASALCSQQTGLLSKVERTSYQERGNKIPRSKSDSNARCELLDNLPFNPPLLKSGTVFTGESGEEVLLGEGK